MTVAVFPSDDGGCGWYRLRFAAEELVRRGLPVVVADSEVTDQGIVQHRRRFDDGRDELEAIEVDAEVLVFQRCVSDAAVEVIAQAKAQGHTVVVDVDDDLDALHPNHPYRDEVSGHQKGRSSANLHAVCHLADLVTVTTQPLADRYAPHGRAAVLPNLVPERYLKHRRVRSKRVVEPALVGWTGRPISHIGDTTVIGHKLGPVLHRHGALFAAWGESAPRTFHELRIPVGHQRRIPFKPLTSGYPQTVARLDVGLVALQDTVFNRAKSWLKGMEYAALGVPFVASPLPEYRKLADMGAGVLARNPDEWAGWVERLLTDVPKRRQLAERGRETVRHLTYEAHAHRWWDAWTAAHNRQEGVAA